MEGNLKMALEGKLGRLELILWARGANGCLFNSNQRNFRL